jgi:hypothetical protein
MSQKLQAQHPLSFFFSSLFNTKEEERPRQPAFLKELDQIRAHGPQGLKGGNVFLLVLPATFEVLRPLQYL